MSSFSIRQSLGRRSSVLLLALVCVMAGLLVLVATLEFRWAKEETAATETRIGTNVESVLVDWHWDFYRQFSAICVALQVGPDSGAFDDWDAYRGRYLRWKQARSYPGLVRDVYIWETSRVRSPRLLQLDGDATQPQNPAPELEPLLARLGSRSGSLRMGLQAWNLSSPGTERDAPGSPYSSLSGWQFDGNVPALVHPIVHYALPGSSGEPVRKGAVDWIVVLLDLQTLRTEILPDLTQRYFERGLNGPLDVTVALGGSPTRILYASNPRDQAVEVRDSDAVMNIFGPAPQTTEGHLWEAVKNANSIEPQEWHSILGPVWFPVIRYSPEDRDWTLILRSRTGRLDDAIDRVRRENMIVSFGVLILLVVNMSLIGISSYRLNRFAQMQMDFVTSISHELRTPLAALLSAGENIRDGVVEDEQRLTRYGNIVTTQAQQLIGLVDQILIFAATRSGQRKYQRRPVSVVALVEALLRANDPLLHKDGFTLEKELASHLPPVLGDPQAVMRILQNLLMNAVKYSRTNRRIGIRAERTLIRRRGFVRITVEDHGIGIAASDVGQIFKPFYRAPDVQAAQIHGTGLGLAVARRIAEDLGGSLTVESRLGHGSRFTLQLPEAEPGAAGEAHQGSWHEREHSFN